MAPRNPSDELSAPLEKAFRFGIGDIVATRTNVARYKARMFVSPKPARTEAWIEKALVPQISEPLALQIIERRIQQCHGGVQIHYLVTGQAESQHALRAEFELMPYAEAMAVCAALAGLPESVAAATDALLFEPQTKE